MRLGAQVGSPTSEAHVKGVFPRIEVIAQRLRVLIEGVCGHCSDEFFLYSFVFTDERIVVVGHGEHNGEILVLRTVQHLRPSVGTLRSMIKLSIQLRWAPGADLVANSVESATWACKHQRD